MWSKHPTIDLHCFNPNDLFFSFGAIASDCTCAKLLSATLLCMMCSCAARIRLLAVLDETHPPAPTNHRHLSAPVSAAPILTLDSHPHEIKSPHGVPLTAKQNSLRRSPKSSFCCKCTIRKTLCPSSWERILECSVPCGLLSSLQSIGEADGAMRSC